MKYSIIIPTYNKLEEALKPCIESILKYTDFNETELIIVANGCTDGTKDYLDSLNNSNIKTLWYNEPLGYTISTNIGIKEAKGEYIVLLNNDTVLLEQNKNQWLEMLRSPFDDLTTGVTGPMKVLSPSSGREFMIFFCVMIKRSVFDHLGLLDEIFSPGYGEDTDFCLRAENEGYKLVQVPGDSLKYYHTDRGKAATASFPIFHDSNVTFRDWPGGDKLLENNNYILQERFKIDISGAQKCDGYMSDVELTWLAKQAKSKDIIIEVGSWHGRSTRVLADNLKKGGVIYAVDHWLGSEVERDTNHISASYNEGDHAFLEFCDNLHEHIIAGRVIPLRMSSKNASNFLKKKGLKADMIFIDAGHTYEEVKDDINYWKDLVKENGILCGHDYYHDEAIWGGVKKAVDEIFVNKGQNMGYIYDNSIWRHYIKTDNKPKIFDCFPFFNELDILEIRLNELYDVVDRFIITEATKTHGGKDKELNFHNNIERFKKFLDKITYIVVDDYPALDSWSIERHQRDSLMKGLKDCKDSDIILISDVDEIPKAEVIKNYKAERGLCCISQDLYYYNFNCKAKQKWNWFRILPYSIMKNMTPCEVRYTVNYDLDKQLIKDGGWHFSYIGDTKKIIEKIEASAHQEYNINYFKNEDEINEKILRGKDLFNRDIEYEYVEIDNSYPSFIVNNIDKYKTKRFIYENNSRNTYEKQI